MKLVQHGGVVAGVAVAALLAAGCGSKIAGQGAPPPVLHLAAGSANTTADTAAVPGVAEGKGGGGSTTGSGYVLQASLPAEPTSAPVYRPSKPDQAAVQRLATALGVTDPVVAANGGYTAGPRLRVDANGMWSYGPSCPDAASDCSVGYAVDQSSVAIGASGSASGYDPGTVDASAAPGPPTKPTAVPPDEPPVAPSPYPVTDDATARRAAAPVLDALDLPSGTTTVSYGYVSADPVIDGLRVAGATTGISVAVEGTISYAFGYLLPTTRGATYPLITAKEAFDQLPPRAVPAIACAVRPGTPVPCPTFPPPVVTKVELGLSLAADDKGPLLVPAWLFTIKDDTEPTPVIAVEAKYIGTPPEPSIVTGSAEAGSAVPPVPANVGGAPGDGEPLPASIPAEAASSSP